MDLKGRIEGRDVLVVSLDVDNLDASNVREFRETIAAVVKDRLRVVVDLSGVKFVDSSGLGALISCQRIMNARKGELRLCSLGSNVRSLFELMRMQRVFDIHDSKESALRSFT